MKLFIPYTDDMLEQLGDDEQLVPYRVGLSLASRDLTGVDAALNPGTETDGLPASRPAPPPSPR